MKKHASVDSAGVSMAFAVEGDMPFVDSTFSHPFWDKYVIGDVTESADDAAVVTIEQSDSLHYDIATGEISCDNDHIPSGIKFAAHLLERERQREGIYMIHGNVISLGETAIACVGGISGIGKTSLAATASEVGWEWTSDEKFLMNEQAEYVQGLATILDDEKTRDAAGDAYPISPRAHRQIGAFVIPIIANQELVIHPYDAHKATYHMYEEMSRNITASRGIFTGYEAPLPSVDTPEIAARRYKCAEALAASVPMYFMMGTVDEIIARLEQEVGR